MSDFDMDAAVAEIGAGLGFADDVQDAGDPLDLDSPDLPEELPEGETVDQSADTPAGEDGEQKPQETVDPDKKDDAEPSALAPKTWRKEAAAEFDKLPQIVKDEISKREEDMFKGLEGYKANAQIGQNFSQVVKPFEQYFAATGVNPYEEIHGLLGMAWTAKFGTPQQKMDLLLTISSDFGVDLLDAAEAQASKPQVDPQVKALQDQINQLKSTRQNEESTREATLKAQVDAQIQAFADDPKHPYFDEVSDHVAGLLHAGVCKTLEEAYEQAIHANPVTRAKEQARLTAEAQAQSKAKAAAAAKASSANLRTNARQASATAPLGSIDDTLAQTLAAIKSRS